MKKRWILLLIAVVLIIAVVVIAIVLNAKNKYFEKLPYDYVNDAIYNDTLIVGEDGLFYLVRDGEHVSRGFTWLVSVNDYYEDLESAMRAQKSDVVLFEYYLAREENHSNYVLLNAAGDEFTVMGDSLTLDDVALPYLIFRDQITSQYAVISLNALDSALSSQSAGELIPTQTFLTVSAENNNPKGALHTHLRTTSTAADQPNSVYDEKGALILSANTLSLITLLDDEEQVTYYWQDTEDSLLYSNSGQLLANGKATVAVSDEQTWGYVLSESISTVEDAETNDFLLVFTAKGSFTLSADDYDLETVVPAKDCVSVADHDHTATLVFNVHSGESASYDTVTKVGNILLATKTDSENTFYLNSDGKLLLESPYADMTVTELSSENCVVFHSVAYDTANGSKLHYHFTASDKTAQTLTVSENQVVTCMDLLYDSALAMTYRITETDPTTTEQTFTLYTPFSTQQTGATYNELGNYSAQGVYWCLGADYTELIYEIVDPVNNRVVASFDLEEEDFARLTFDCVLSDQLITDPYDEESGVPVVILSLSRFEEKIDSISRTRYIALYRQATVGDQEYHNRTMVAKEIGQDLISYHSTPVTFLSEGNYLLLHDAMGSKTMRMDESLDLIETTSLPYPIEMVLTDRADPSKTYLVLASGGMDHPDNRQFGLADADGTILMAPYYDSIDSIDDNRIVAQLRGGYCLLEYRKDKLKTLIDPIYQSIAVLGDGGYLAYDSFGHSYLYQEGDLLIDDPLPMIQLPTVLRADNDDHAVQGHALLINHNGKLKLHMPETMHRLTCNSFTQLPSYLTDEINHRHGQLVCYYGADGTLLKTDMILPTFESLKTFAQSFAADETDWYLTPVAEKQTEVPLFETIVSAQKNHIIKLYAKADES